MAVRTNQSNRPLHIGINALQVRAAKSGVGQYIAGLVGALLELDEFRHGGCRLTLFATPENAPNYQFESPRYRCRVWGRPGASLAERRIREWLFLPSAIKHEGIDVWHGPSNFLPVRRVPDCAYVMTLHDVSYWLFPRRVTPLKSLYWRAWTARSLSVADHFITASRHARETIGEVLGIPPERFDIIPHAAHEHFRPDPRLHRQADAYWFEKSSEPEEMMDSSVLERFGLKPGGYLLSICTLEPGKNLPTLVDAYARLRERRHGDPRFDGLKLVLVGDRGWLMDPLFQRIREQGLSESVLVTGHLTDADLPPLLNSCGCFCFLSLNEGFGLPPLEALACGVPVVAADASSLPEVLGSAALLVPPLDVGKIVPALEQSLTVPELRRRLRNAGPIRAGRYSWKQTARLTWRAYARIFNEIRHAGVPVLR